MPRQNQSGSNWLERKAIRLAHLINVVFGWRFLKQPSPNSGISGVRTLVLAPGYLSFPFDH